MANIYCWVKDKYNREGTSYEDKQIIEKEQENRKKNEGEMHESGILSYEIEAWSRITRFNIWGRIYLLTPRHLTHLIHSDIL